MKARLKKVILISAVTLIVGCAYAVFYSLTGFGVPCPFHVLTGLNCPGCGITRMAVSLLRFDLHSAFEANAFVLLLLPLGLGILAFRLYRYVRYDEGSSGKKASAMYWSIAALLLVWGIVRNIIKM